MHDRNKRGNGMRLMLRTALGVALLAAAIPASAATIVIYMDPLTLERRIVVADPDGPDRAFLCMLPPAQSGCQQVKMTRG